MALGLTLAVAVGGCASATAPGAGGDDSPAADASVVVDVPPDACADGDQDGACDAVDLCPGFDDRVDTDADTVADGCDLCPGFDDRIDVNNNQLPDACELMTRTIDVKKVGTNHWRGWYATTSSHSTTNDNTITGELGGQTYNSYFVFSLAGFTATSISTVTLVLEVEAYSGDATETATVWDVTTATSTLETSGVNATILADLQGGVQYATQALTSASVGQNASIPLAAAAATDLQAKLGGEFAVGVHNATGPGYFRFSQGGEDRVARLVIEYLP